MKKIAILVLTFILCAAVFVMPAAAYIQRGTVHITADKTALELKVGETGTVAITLDPAEDDQMPGCGMSDCPEKCGQNCLSKDGNCTCDITSYETYYTEVQLKNSAPEVAEAEYADGVLTIKALTAGETTINTAARLREYMGSSVDITVTVVDAGLSIGAIVGICAGVVVIAAVVVVIVVKGKKK